MPVNPTVRPVTALLAAGLALGLAACAGEAVPAGWSAHEVGTLDVAYPDRWQPIPAESLEGSTFWSSGAQDELGDEATVQLLLGPDFSDDDRAGAAADRLVAPAQIGVPFDGWRTSGRTEVEVPGATSAERWDFSYTGEDGATVEGVWVVMADEETGTSAAVQLTGTPLDEQVVFDLVASLRFDPDRAGDTEAGGPAETAR